MSSDGRVRVETGARDSRPVLLLMSSRTYRAGAFLDAARALAVPAVIGTEAETPLAAGRGLRIDFGNPQESVDRLVAYAQGAPVGAVISAEDDGTWLASETSRRLGLSHNPPEAVAVIRDKAALREHLLEAGLPAPKGLRIDLESDPEDLADRLPYPCVLKPRFLSGSQGVMRVNGPGEFVFGFQRLRRLLQQPGIRRLGDDLAESLWCEAFVSGDEVALEGMLTGGRLQVLALFDKPDPMDGPFFEETIYVTPSRHPEESQRDVADVVQRSVSALGLRTGPVHAELRINAQGAWLIDLAPRSIGGLCAKSLRFGEGESLESLILRQALGDDVSEVRRERDASGVMMIPIPSAGRLVGVSGLDTATAVAGVDEVILSVPIGDILVPAPEGGRYLGFIFARSEMPGEVEAALRQGHACLEFDIAPD
jgi:hypothetical protein